MPAAGMGHQPIGPGHRPRHGQRGRPRQTAWRMKKAWIPSSDGIRLFSDEGWITGFEPATSASRTRNPRVLSGKFKRVTKRSGSASPVASPRDSKTGHEFRSEPANDDGFADAVQAIMRLPQSNAEKDAAVRRLMNGSPWQL